MTAANSPYYAAGREDGADDKALVESCPPAAPLGMNAHMAWSVMYREGYATGFGDAQPHVPCDNCRGGKAPGG